MKFCNRNRMMIKHDAVKVGHSVYYLVLVFSIHHENKLEDEILERLLTLTRLDIAQLQLLLLVGQLPRVTLSDEKYL